MTSSTRWRPSTSWSGSPPHTNAQVPVHPEAVAGDDKGPLALAEPQAEVRGVDVEIVANERHAAGLGRNEMKESTVAFNPGLRRHQVLPQHGAVALEDDRSLVGL